MEIYRNAAFKLQMEWGKHSYFKKNYSFSAALKYLCSCILNGDDGKTLSFNSVIRLEEKKFQKMVEEKREKKAAKTFALCYQQLENTWKKLTSV